MVPVIVDEDWLVSVGPVVVVIGVELGSTRVVLKIVSLVELGLGSVVVLTTGTAFSVQHHSLASG